MSWLVVSEAGRVGSKSYLRVLRQGGFDWTSNLAIATRFGSESDAKRATVLVFGGRVEELKEEEKKC